MCVCVCVCVNNALFQNGLLQKLFQTIKNYVPNLNKKMLQV